MMTEDRSARFLPYGRQDIDDSDIAAVTAALRSDWLTQGPRVEAFEAALAARVGAAEAVACSSGTAALHLAALALGLGPGDAVVVPAVTFMATANAARMVGANVVFADVDPDTGLTTPAAAAAAAALAKRRGWRPRAVFPVHFAGQSCDVAAIVAAVAAEAGATPLAVEDACHALGSETATGEGEWRPVGACADAAITCFSFHPVKTIAAGEGGAAVVNDPALAARLRRARCHGINRDPAAFDDVAAATAADGSINPWWHEMVDLGYNYRLTDLQCALGASQLRRLDAFAARRRRLAALYQAGLAPLAPRVRPLAHVPGCRPAWHLQVALIDFTDGPDRAAVMNGLRRRGVGSQVHYIPLYRHPYYRPLHDAPPLPGAEAYYARALSLPLFATMEDDDVRRVVDALAEALS